MIESEAKMYLEAMARGIDPLTGEILPEDHLLCETDIREALLIALEQFHTVQPPVARDPWVRKNGKLNAGRPWTEQDNEMLITLDNLGVPYAEIAQRMQRRERGVRNHLALLRSKEKRRTNNIPWTADDDVQLQQLVARHMSLGQIAAAMGKSVMAVENRLSELDNR